MPPPTIDGHAAVAGHVSGTGPYNITLTTTQSNDIIVLMFYNENANTSAIASITNISGGGLTWQKRAGMSYITNPAIGGHTSGISLEYWWAKAPSPLAAVVFAVTLNATTDDYVLVAFGVHGCDATNPWDGNGTLPKLGATDEARPTTVSGANTTQANDFLLCLSGATIGPGVPPNPAGWTLIDSAGTNAAVLDAAGGSWSQSVTTKQTNFSATIDYGSGVSGHAMILDALTADASGGGGGGGGGGGSSQGSHGHGHGQGQGPQGPSPQGPIPMVQQRPRLVKNLELRKRWKQRGRRAGR